VLDVFRLCTLARILCRTVVAGALTAEHPDVYHLPMVKEHRLDDIIANSVTHGIGAGLAFAGTVVLVVTTVGGRLGRLPVARFLAVHWCWSMSALLCITRSFAPARVTFCKSLIIRQSIF